MASRPASPVLLSFFEPFGGAEFNASSLVAEVEPRLPAGSIKLVTLPVSFRRSWSMLESHLRANQDYSAVIAFGEANGRTKVSVERIAINWQEASLADNDGFQPNGEPLIAGSPDGIITSLPIGKLQRALQGKTPIEVEVSNTAGTYVCNGLMYHLLNWARPQNIPAGFVHVPALRPTDLDFNAKRAALVSTLDSLVTQVQALTQ